MYGIDLNKKIEYIYSSLRFFSENEHYINRFCEDDVLLLVYDGVLRFNEDGVSYEVHPGEYHIHKHNTFHTGELKSDGPKYLYIHFKAEWTDAGNSLPRNGIFDYAKFKDDIEEMDALSYSDSPYILKSAKLHEILSKLYKTIIANTDQSEIVDFIKNNYREQINLNMMCRKFSFSKNHIINLLKKELCQTPIAYLNAVRLNNAEQLLISTSESIERISYDCGYQNYSHFYRQFTRKNGISPEKFRQQKRMGK